MRLFVYDMLVNVNVIYYVHVCEQARWARSVGNSAIENVCIIIKHWNTTHTGRPEWVALLPVAALGLPR